MTIAERMSEQAEAQAAALLSEPVVGIAFANRCGTLGTIVANTALDIAAGVAGDQFGGGTVAKDEIRCDGAKPVSLPTAFLLAVTAARIHVFKIKMAMGRVKLKDELAAFDRAGLQSAVDNQSLVTVFRIRAPRQGMDMAFEIMKSDYATDFAGLIHQGAGS